MHLFQLCHHFTASGMGGLSINLVHLPHPGGILDQSARTLRCFEIIKRAMYERQEAMNAKRN